MIKSKSYTIQYKQALASWRCMLRRCNSAYDKDYKNYGAKGIKVCLNWYDFKSFISDMGYPPDDPNTGERMTLDRIDNNKGYCRENCRWATRSEQNLNRREYSVNKVSSEASPTPEFEITFEGIVIKLSRGG